MVHDIDLKKNEIEKKADWKKIHTFNNLFPFPFPFNIFHSIDIIVNVLWNCLIIIVDAGIHIFIIFISF